MTRYADLYRTRDAATLQSEPMPGREKDQVKNRAGGYVFQANDWQRLTRFLILGSASGTYYVKPQPLTRENAEVVLRCLEADSYRTIDEISKISLAGRAARNNAAIFALALCAGLGSAEASKLAYEAMPLVVRTGDHLFQFNESVNAFRGWGRMRRSAFARWYNTKEIEPLIYQLLKYRQRGGWSHIDLLRMAHVKPATALHSAVYQYITKGTLDGDSLRLATVFERAKQITTEKEMIALIQSENLTWEFVPDQWLGKPTIWQALLPRLPITALIRNLGRLTSYKVLRPLCDEIAIAVDKLTNPLVLQRGRVHPLSLLVASKIYTDGQGDKGTLHWVPVPQITQALEKAYYLSFDSVEPSDRRILLALDVSGSMASAMIANSPLSCAEGAGAMAMVVARTEPNYHIVAFNDGIQPLNITAQTAMPDVMKQITRINTSRTDCAQAMLWATEHGIKVDQFVIITDNETWAGAMHPMQALQRYRQQSGIHAKMVVVAMTSDGFTIADPDDADTLDVVGFDTQTPQMISEFAKGF